MSTVLQAAIASAPPEPPSPITTPTFGTPIERHVSIERAMASAWPRSSASTPGKAPAVSIREITGRAKRSASCMRRVALRYPSGRAMPKLCLTRLGVSSPFSWPITHTNSPSKSSEAPYDGFVLAEIAVAGEGCELGDERLDIVAEMRPPLGARDLGFLPGGESGVEIGQRLLGLGLELRELLGERGNRLSPLRRAFRRDGPRYPRLPFQS